MSNFGAVSMDAIARRGAISAADVLALRQEIYGGTSQISKIKTLKVKISKIIISKIQAEEIIALDRDCTVQDADWQDFYIEVITDYIVEKSEPRGYITVQNADWLMDQLGDDGRVKTARGMELLAHILDKSRWSPTSLVQFTLNQIKAGIIESDGHLRDGKELEPGVIGEAEVTLIRRVLFAFGGDGNIAISKAEAEILFDLNANTSEAGNHPSWTDLFAKSIANYVMGASGYRVPNRIEALRRQEWVEDSSTDTKDFISRMVSGGLKNIWDVYQQQSREDREISRLESQKISIITAEAIGEDEAGWLTARILRDGEICENEKALLAFIRSEAPNIHPSLKPLLADAA